MYLKIRRVTCVVELLGSFQDAAALYLVQRWCGRGDLYKHMLARGGTLPEWQVRQHVRTIQCYPLTSGH